VLVSLVAYPPSKRSPKRRIRALQGLTLPGDLRSGSKPPETCDKRMIPIHRRRCSLGRTMRALIFAYACEPDQGSEPRAGWAWSRMLARMGEVWVITRANNRGRIEGALPGTSEGPGMHFEYVDPHAARSSGSVGRVARTCITCCGRRQPFGGLGSSLAKAPSISSGT
jgi:hypothetical protein